MKIKRNKNGQFTDSSNYGKRQFGVRLLKQDEIRLIEIANKKGITPTQMGRIAIAEWLKQNN